jgi:serine/threonine-protein kinase
MSAATALVLALGAACLGLAVIHVVMWIAVPAERVQLWIGVALAAFGVLGASVAFISSWSRPFVTHRGLYVVATAAGPIIVHFCVRSAYDALQLGTTWWRRIALWGGTLGITLRVVDRSVVLASWPPDTPITWDELARDPGRWTHWPFVLPMAVAALILVVDAVGAARQRGGIAWAIAAAAFALAAVFVYLLASAGEEAIFYFPLVAVPYAAFALGRLAVLALRGLRGADPLSGVERYRKLHRLGAGGMGEAWLAVRTGERGFHRLVVVKQMRARSEQAGVSLERFLAEARHAARLDHPGIVSVYDVGKLAGGWYIVMEYLSGITLADLLADARRSGQPIPRDLVAEIGIQLGRALAHAHAAGVVHRDVSPDNGIITFHGTVKVIDFGIAQAQGDPIEPVRTGESSGRLTEVGSIIGKKPYMAPERLHGAEATPASDIFALSVVLYELLTLARPALGADLSRSVTLDETLEAVDAAPFTEVLRRGLDRRAERRFATGVDLAVALQYMRRDLSPIDIEEWTRTTFPERVARQHALAALTDPSPADVAKIFRGAATDAPDVTPATDSTVAEPTVGERPSDRAARPAVDSST